MVFSITRLGHMFSFLVVGVFFFSCNRNPGIGNSGYKYLIENVPGTKNLYLKAEEFTGVIISDKLNDSTAFIPSVEEIFKAEQIFQKCLTLGGVDINGIEMSSNRIQHLSKYYRQYQGYYNEIGEKIVFINCFIKQSVESDPNWKKTMKLTRDGGNNYFNIEINITTGACSSFLINGHAYSRHPSYNVNVRYENRIYTSMTVQI